MRMYACMHMCLYNSVELIPRFNKITKTKEKDDFS